MKTAVIYARFSCSKQREASIDDQLRVCRAWCEREGYAVVREYFDYAISGRTDERPQFQRMIENAGESEIVLVYMMDRFSRDEYDSPLYKKRLKDRGVRVVSATEAIPDSPEAILIEKIYEGLAAVESIHISVRTKRGMNGNALKCRHNGVRVFGYSHGEDGRYVVDEAEAEIVRECFARKIAGEAVNSIASDLARRGVKTYAGNPASYTFVYNMLKNEKYTGVYIFGDVRQEGGMPQIIGKGDFAMAQQVQPKKRRADEEWGVFALSGKAVCGGCGRNMAGASGRGKGNVKYSYYRCGQKCGVRPVRADWLEAETASRVRAILSNREDAMDVARIVGRFVSDTGSDARAEQARKRRDDAERAIKNLTRAVADGMDYADVKDDLERYKVQLAAAGAEAAMYEEAARFDAEDFADFLQFGATLDDASLLDAMVGQVIVGDEDVTVALNYDVRAGEPARFSFERVLEISPLGPENSSTPESPADSGVRTDCVWLPKDKVGRTLVAVVGGFVLLRFPRTA